MSSSALSVANLEETLRCASAAEEMSRSWLATYGDTQQAADLLQVALRCLRCEVRSSALAGREIVALLVNCFSVDLMPPAWLSKAFAERALAALTGKALNWDDADAFGSPMPPGFGRPAMNNYLFDGPKAYCLALDLLAQSQGEKVPGGLYNRVSQSLEISPKSAQTLLKEVQLQRGLPDLNAVRRELQAGCSLQTALIRVMADSLHREQVAQDSTRQDWFDDQDTDAAEDLD